MSRWPQADWRRQIYRASRLDEFRLYLSGEQYNGDEYGAADFIDRMTQPFTNAAMEAGTAVHAVIETAPFGDLPERSEMNGWRIHFDLNAEMRLPTVREIPLHIEHDGIPLFGRVDAIGTHTVHDIKTTSSIDIDRYLDSYQWRAYLYMSGREQFVYDILRVKLEEDAKLVVVQEYVPVKIAAYPRLARDVETLLQDFHACVRALGIDELMQQKAAA